MNYFDKIHVLFYFGFKIPSVEGNMKKWSPVVLVSWMIIVSYNSFPSWTCRFLQPRE